MEEFGVDPYGTFGEANRGYVEVIGRLRSVQSADRARSLRVKLIHFGEVREDTLVEVVKRTRRLAKQQPKLSDGS